MKTEDALNFITQALNQATLKGAFTLQDASNVALAINTVAKYIQVQSAINIQKENTKTQSKVSECINEPRIGEIKTHEGVDNKAKYDLLQINKKEQ